MIFRKGRRSQYDFQFKSNQTLNDRPIDDPWFEHTQEIKKKLANKHGLLHRRLWEVAIPMDLIPPNCARHVMFTMTDAISTSEFAEVWPNSSGSKSEKIQSQLNDIYRTIIGAKAKSSSSALHHELGIIPQHIRAHAAILKFRNHILGPENDRLPKRLSSEGSFEGFAKWHGPQKKLGPFFCYPDSLKTRGSQRSVWGKRQLKLVLKILLKKTGWFILRRIWMKLIKSSKYH